MVSSYEHTKKVRGKGKRRLILTPHCKRMATSEGVKKYKKTQENRLFAHRRLVSGTCTCFRIIHAKGTGGRWVREGLMDKNVLCMSFLTAELLGGMPDCHF